MRDVLHVITVDTAVTLNKYSVAVPYENDVYRTLTEAEPIYMSIQTYGLGRVGARGFIRGRTSEIVFW